MLMVEVEAGPGLPTAGDAAPGGEGLTQDGCNSTRQLWVPKKWHSKAASQGIPQLNCDLWGLGGRPEELSEEVSSCISGITIPHHSPIIV